MSKLDNGFSDLTEKSKIQIEGVNDHSEVDIHTGNVTQEQGNRVEGDVSNGHIAARDIHITHIHNLQPNLLNPKTKSSKAFNISTTRNYRRLLTSKKITFILSVILILIFVCFVPIPRHHKISAFEQITHQTILDSFHEWGEKIYSYMYQTPLSIMVIYSEKAPYEEIIVNSLLEHLNNKVWNFEYAIYDGFFVDPLSPKGKEIWDEKINNIIKRTSKKKVDYLISVGTYTTTAIRDTKLIDRYGAKGLVFLGITDPVKGGIVKSLDNRHEDTKITGVRYGTGNEDGYGNAISSLFPKEQKLVFVYNKNTRQDEYVAKNLTGFKIDKDERFELRPKDGDINLNDLNSKQPNDPPEVYFAWYGLDNVLRDNGTSDGVNALINKWVVPSTYSTDNLEKAGIIVSVSDQEVGRLGAEIIFKNYLNPELPLDHEPVATTPFLTWVDCHVIKNKGITLTASILEAHEIKNEEDCPLVIQRGG